MCELVQPSGRVGSRGDGSPRLRFVTQHGGGASGQPRQDCDFFLGVGSNYSLKNIVSPFRVGGWVAEWFFTYETGGGQANIIFSAGIPVLHLHSRKYLEVLF
jgi:hypothetical protein